ncbi:DUF3970 domain-containing protein [Priestia megaterium]|nr:DUF3970 domain-containing protein [Priestia megaterium]
MIQVRLLGEQQEIKKMIKSFEEHYHVEHQSDAYTRSNNPKYANKKDTRIYLSMKLKTE